MQQANIYIDDNENEIPVFGGIFRGRPVAFSVEITAPENEGSYTTNWSMFQDDSGWFGDILTKQISVTGSTGISEFNNEFKIYPNPANTYIIIENIKGNAENIEVIDITGKTLWQLKIENAKLKIQVADLEGGVYFVKIGNTVRKFIKM